MWEQRSRLKKVQARAKEMASKQVGPMIPLWGILTKKPRITWESAGGVWMPLQWRTTWTSSLWSHFYTSMENAMLEILFGKDYIYEYTSKIHDIEYLL